MLLVSSTALADEPEVEPERAGLEIGVSLLGSAGAVFLNEPEDQTVTIGASEVDVVYPGFGGVAFGGGLTLDIRYAGIVGIETGALLSRDYGAGEINDVNITIGQSSVHVPLILKLMIPTGMARPFLFGGLEFVMPGEASAEHDSDLLPEDLFTAVADPYRLVSFGFGLEALVGNDNVDIRIPIAIRGGINTSTPEGVEGRAEYNLGSGSIEFNSEFQYHIMMTVGVSYFRGF